VSRNLPSRNGILADQPTFTELKDTETAHKDAMSELEKMKETMDKMEQERADMVAEVEAQIERALASMAVEMEDSDYGSSRPDSRLSSVSGSARSRRTSDATKTRPLRSFATESTLAESCEEEGGGTSPVGKTERETGTIEEDEEEDATMSPSRKKRFSASEANMPQDGMNAVDEGISLKSDKIARKVLEIQQKVSCSADECAT
jgi:nicotinamide N-methyltransferase